MKWPKYFSLIFLLPYLLYTLFNTNFVLKLCNMDSCPLCFGETLCDDIQNNKIVLKYSTLSNFIYNVLSVKNVYFGQYYTKSVVLKKLAQNSEFVDLSVCDSDYDIEAFLTSEHNTLKQFKFCDLKTARKLLNTLQCKNTTHLCTIFHVNIEPILLEIFSKEEKWPVAMLYGFCGKLVVEEYCGENLNSIEHYNWFDRAYVALQILQLAKNFTENHRMFRLYLTDISPDNIVVDANLKVSVIDLEHIILKTKGFNGTIHHSKDFGDDLYAFSDIDVCSFEISDHNIYSVCKLLLSRYAPWPMMKNGLLHTPPILISELHKELFENVEMCVQPCDHISRFEISDKILVSLEKILKSNTHYCK